MSKHYRTYVFMAGTYLVNYANTHLGQSRNLVLFAGVLGGLSMVVFVAVSAHLSDTLGRRRTALFAWVLAVPWSFAVMPLINTGDSVVFVVVIITTFAMAGLCFGPMPAFISELFATRYRYTGAAMALNLAGIIGGAVPPLIAGVLLTDFGSEAIGLMMGVLVVTSLVCTWFLPETLGVSLADTDTRQTGPHIGTTGAYANDGK